MPETRKLGRGPVIQPTPALLAWLEAQAQAADDSLAKLPAVVQHWIKTSDSPRVGAGYMVGWADAMRYAAESIQRGLRMWIDTETGELVAVDVRGDPEPGSDPGP